MADQDEELFWVMQDVGSCVRYQDTTCKGYSCWDSHASNLAEEGSPCEGSYHSVYQIGTHHWSHSLWDLQQSMGPPHSRVWPNQLRLTDALVPSPDQTVTTWWWCSHWDSTRWSQDPITRLTMIACFPCLLWTWMANYNCGVGHVMWLPCSSHCSMCPPQTKWHPRH